MSISRGILCVLLLCSTCWAAKIRGVEIPDHELIAIHAAVERNVPKPDLHAYFTKVLIAIRLAENGKKGREFGILVEGVDTFDQQAGWCAATCWKNWKRWERTEQVLPYLVFLRDRYAPVGARNDPKGLNKHWLRNVVRILQQMEGDR